MGRILVLAGLLPLLLLAVAPCELAVPVEAAGHPIPQLAMSFSTSGAIAYPSFFAPGSARIDGTLSIDKVSGERIYVMITASTDTGWAASIDRPQPYFATNIKVVAFTVTVTVPAGTPVDMVGDLRVEAHGQGLGFNPMVVGHAVISVAPFFKMYINSPNPYKEVTPGSRLSFLVELQNYGNSMDSYDVYIENQEELVGMGWMVSFSTPVVTKVRAGDSKTIRLYVMAPQKSVLYKAEGSIISVKAVSQNARDKDEEVGMAYPFVVYERGSFIDAFATGWATLVLLAFGAPTVYIMRRLWRWNKARVRDADDDYDDLDDDEYDDEDYDDEDYEDDEYEDDDKDGK